MFLLVLTVILQGSSEITQTEFLEIFSSNLQSGFKLNNFCVNQLISIHHSIFSAFGTNHLLE